MSDRSKYALGLVVLGLALLVVSAYTQTNRAPASPPNPYRTIANWAQLPKDRKWGQTSAIDVDSQDHVWVADRCGGTSCADSKDDPIFEFDPSGKLLKTFGAGMFIYPHGIFVDRSGNVWVTDAQAANGKGQQVFKFSPEGKLLLTLGTAGVSGSGPNSFNQPSDVLVAPDGDIFVADGHAPGYFSARIVKFSRDGKFIKTWGARGSAPGDFLGPHSLAMDSKGRLFVGDRSNSRIQIFDQDGKFLDQWKQFGRPSGLFIDRNDVLYAADSESMSQSIDWSGQPASLGLPPLPQGYGYNPGFKRGIRIGSAKDGKVTAFIPDPAPELPPAPTSAAEGVAADSKGAIYGAEVGPRDVKKYVKK
jgi:DNA-binding beta-propeller fold protein YncE